MAKIMLVEDDNNLREIYEARLLAEGYEIVSAEDGEQALAMAVKEKPDLIISDVMMPKISGFDMLDILRSTPETRDTKVIMMTALSQVEDKTRADKLGADRYLVKSQVTLEDVAKVAKEVLDGQPAAAAPVAAATVVSDPAPVADSSTETPAPEPIAVAPTNPTPAATPTPEPVVAPAEPPAAPVAAATSTAPEPPAQTTASEEQAIEDQISSFVNNLPADPAPVANPTPAATPTPEPVVAPAEPPAAPVAAATSTAPEPIAVAEPPKEPPVDGTAAAAENAAKMVEAANELLRDSEPANSDAKPSTSMPGKKVIQPLGDVSASQGPDLDALLAKEEAKERALATPTTDEPPAADPAAATNSADDDPNNIAL